MTNKKEVNSRPTIEKALVSEKMTAVEKFQNTTLRQIIKMKHELLIAYFNHYLASQKFDFKALSELQKIEFFERTFSKDSQCKNEIKGIIIGHFTLDEFSIYKNINKESNKRILSMVKERILNTLIQ
ncbi:MAG: glyoxalase [Lutibacter sp.]|nr:glyoxalase [Lutibacter sp.]